jgi:F-type H+-transporting ATPase subunit b
MMNINPWDILWTVVNLLILFLLLKKFLFGRVTAMMDRRAQMIQNDLESAKQAKEESEQLKEKYEAELKDAHTEAVKITAEAKQRADKESVKIINEAHDEAAHIISDAEKVIEREREDAVAAAKEQIAGLAVMAASQVLAKNIDEESNREFAERLLAEVGADND